MQPLMVRLEYINDQCQDPEKRRAKNEAAKKWDDFTKLRKKIAADIKQIRQQIEDRNNLLGKTDSANTQTVRMGKDIRNGLKDAMREVEQLDVLQKKDAERIESKKLRKKEVSKEEEEESVHRADIVALCKQHIEECRRLEKSVKGTMSGVYVDANTSDQVPTVTSLPNIDGEGFQLLRLQDDEIDKQLEEVSKGVAALRDVAVDMSREIELHEVIIGELDHKVELTNIQFVNLNKRLKKTLESVRKADRFCIDIILLVVLLAIGGYLYNLFS